MSDFLWSLAWRDHRLQTACTDVQAGLLGAARLVLAETRDTREFARRGYASAVLGSLAARSDVAEQWLRDEPKDPDALLLAARVVAVRTAAAYRKRHARARKLLTQALDLAGRCALAWPDDPTPYVVVLSLARFECQQVPVSDALPELEGIEGPWGLVEKEIWPRDPYSRETGRHLLAFFGARDEAAVTTQVALSVAARSPLPSALRLLPLAAFLEFPVTIEAAEAADIDRYERINGLRELVAEVDERLKTGAGADGYTAGNDLLERRERLTRTIEDMTREGDAAARRLRPAMVRELTDLHALWFNHRPGPQEYVPIADVSLLARGLQLGGEHSRAAVALRHMLPHATAYPWKLAGDPETVLAAAIAECSAKSYLPLPTSPTSQPTARAGAGNEADG